MGFFFKKSFNIGPVRINLSKSGAGVSVGGKGFRVSSGPKGEYVQAGRKGLYYRKTLGFGMFVVLLIAALGYWAFTSVFITINMP